jgi:hypothetical protein
VPSSDGTGHGYEIGFIPVTQHDSNTHVGGFGDFNMQGTVDAGFNHEEDVTISCTPSGGQFCAPTVAPGATYTETYDPSFDANGYDSQDTGQSVSQNPVGAVFLSNLYAAAGSVTIDASEIGGGSSASITAHGGPQINVTNSTADYLIIGVPALNSGNTPVAQIPDLDGGSIFFTGAAQQPNAPGFQLHPLGATAIGAITIHNTFTCTAGSTCVGTSNQGPALFVTGDISNLGGDINLLDDWGSIFTNGGTESLGLDISAPHGTVTVDTNQSGNPFQGVNPQSEFQDDMIWPGNNPTLNIGINYNVAVAYAINAFYAEEVGSDPSSATALSQAMYGHANTADGLLEPGFQTGDGTWLNYYPWGFSNDPGPAAGQGTIDWYGSCVPYPGVASNGADCSSGTASSLSPSGSAYQTGSGDELYYPTIPTESLSENTNTWPTVSQSNTINADNVVITGTEVAINSTITAGQPTNWALYIPSSYEIVFAILQVNYALFGGSTSIPIDTADPTFAYYGSDVQPIGASYDPATNQVIVDNVAASAGTASVEINGGVMASSNLGNIHVEGGLGTIQIENDSGALLKTQNLYAGSVSAATQNQSTIEIIDTFSGKHTLYAYNGGSVEEFQQANGVSIGSTTCPCTTANTGTEHVALSSSALETNPFAVTFSGNYSPEANMRWNWWLTAGFERTVSYDSNSNLTASAWKNDTGNTNNPWVFCTNSSCSGTDPFDDPSGFAQPIGTLEFNDPSSFIFTQTITTPDNFADLNTNYAQDDYHSCGTGAPAGIGGGNVCNFGFQKTTSDADYNSNSDKGHGYAEWVTAYPQDISLIMAMSLSASNPIGVSFAGANNGFISVLSDEPILVAGQVTNPNGTTYIESDPTDFACGNGCVSPMFNRACGNACAGPGGPITVGPAGEVTSQDLTLIATGTGSLGGLGTSQNPIPVTMTNTGTLYAEGNSQGAYLALQTGATFTGLGASDSSGFGDVVVTALGAIGPANSSVTVVGDDITLYTTQGSIGSLASPWPIDANYTQASSGGTIGGVVNASAPGDIGLDQISGNLLLGQLSPSLAASSRCVDSSDITDAPTQGLPQSGICTSGGSVLLEVPNGSVLDASGQTASSVLSTTQVQGIESRLNLLDSTNAIEAGFNNEVDQNYDQYWLLLANGMAPGGVYTLGSTVPGSAQVLALTPDTAAALDLANPTAADVADYASYLYTETVDFFNNQATPGYTSPDPAARTLPPLGAPLTGYPDPIVGNCTTPNCWLSTTDFQTFNPSFSFTLSNAEDQVLQGDSVWTADQLLHAINDIGLQSASGTPVGIGNPNISAPNTVTIDTGVAIGELASPAEICIGSLSNASICTGDLRSGSISPAQAGALAVANAPGDVTLSGIDEIVLPFIGPIPTPVTYSLASQSGNNTFVGLTNTGATVTFTLESVDAAGDLVGVDGSGNVVTLTTVDVAQTAPLFIDVLGTLTTCVSTTDHFSPCTNPGTTGATFIQSTDESPLEIGSITAGGDIEVTSPGSIVSAGSANPQITGGGDLRLLAGSGDIGATGTPLVVDIGGQLVSAVAGGLINLTWTNGDLNFGRISAGANATLNVPNGGLFQTTPGIIGISAQTLNVNVKTSVGTSTSPIELSIPGAVTVTGPNGVYLGTIGPNSPLVIGTITVTNGDAGLYVQGNVTLGQIKASDMISIFSEGTIDESGDTSPPPTGDPNPNANLIAPNGVLESLAGIGLGTAQVETAFGKLELSSLGVMWLINYGNLIVDQITNSPLCSGVGTGQNCSIPTGIVTQGTLNLMVDSDLTINQPIDSNGGPITETSDGDMTVNAAITSEGGTVSLTAGGDIVFTANGTVDVGSGTPQVTISAEGLQTSDGTGLVTMDSGSFIHGVGGPVQISGLSTVTLTSVTSTGAVTVDSTNGSILDGNVGTATAGAIDIVGGQITLTAGATIGTSTNALLIDHTGSGDIGTLTAGTGMWITQTGGPLQIATASSSTGDIVLTVANSGAMDQDLILADMTASISALGGSITLNAPGGNITFDQGASVAASAAITATAEDALTATGAMLAATNGDLQLTGGTTLTLHGGTTKSLKGNVTLHANGGALTIDQSAVVSAGKALTGTASTLVSVTGATLTASGGAASLTANGGSVDLSSSTAVNASTNVTLTASTSIQADGGQLEALTGFVQLNANGGSLTLDQGITLSSGTTITGTATTSVALTGIDSTSGTSTTFTAGTGLTMNGGTVAASAGFATLSANGGTLLVENSASVSATGALNGTASGDLTVDATSSLEAGTIMTLKLGQDNAAHTGTLDGTFTGPLMQISGGNGGDAITLAPVALNGYTQVAGGTGTNDIVLSLPSIDVAHKLNSSATGPAALINGTSAQGDPRNDEGTMVPLRNMVDVNGGSVTSTIEVDLSGTTLDPNGTDYVVNASDAGNLLLKAPAQASTFLVRADFVALVHPANGAGADGPFATGYERVNYVASVGKVTIDGSNHGDHYFLIDTGAPLVVNAGSGNDAFQFGGLFGSPQTAPSIVAAGDQVSTVSTEWGDLSPGVSFQTTVNGGSGNDAFLVYNNQAPLSLLGGGGDDTFTVQSFAIDDAPLTIDGGTGHSSLLTLGTQLPELFALSSVGIMGAGLNIGYAHLDWVQLNGNGGGDTFDVLSTVAGAVTQIDGSDTGSDTFNVGGDVVGTLNAVNASHQPAAVTPFAGPQDTAVLAGPLVLDTGGIPAPALISGVQLPTELNTSLPIVAPLQVDKLAVSTLNVFDDVNSTSQTGTLGGISGSQLGGLETLYGATVPGTLPLTAFGEISGLGTSTSGSLNLGSKLGTVHVDGGIVYSGMAIVDLMLGTTSTSADIFTVNSTVEASITVIQGGGGNSVLVADGGGGPLAPLVLFSGTSQDGSFYNSTPTNLTGWARAYNNPGDASVIDARGDTQGVVMYGGTGDVTLYGSSGGDDQIAGGSGVDTIWAGSGNEDIYGNDGFNLNLSRTLAMSNDEQAQVLLVTDVATPDGSPTEDMLNAAPDEIHGGFGNDVIIGHWGYITVAPKTNILITTGGITGIYTQDNDATADVQISGDNGSYIVLGGGGDSTIDLHGAQFYPDLIIGHDGYLQFSAPEDFTSVGGWYTQLAFVTSRDPLRASNDRLIAGPGPAVIIGGAGNNYIQTIGGNDLIFGNDGSITYANGEPSVMLSENDNVQANQSFDGNTIITGPGNDVIIGGSGNNTINVGTGKSVVIGANGEVHFNSSGQPVLAEYRFPTFGGADTITIAGGSPVSAPSAYGKVGTGGIVLESKGGGTLSAPGSYLVVGYSSTNSEGTYSTSKGGWINPRAKAPKQPKPGTVKIGSKGSVSSKGVASVTISCRGGSCSGKLTLTFVPKHGHKVVTAGSVTYTVSAGKSKTLKIKLSKAAKSALTGGKGTLKVKATAIPSKGKKKTAKVTLTEAKKKKKKSTRQRREN